MKRSVWRHVAEGWPCLSISVSAAVLGACANAGQIPLSSAAGMVTVYTGDKPVQWPAQHVTWNHPANSEAMPFSKRLWDAGYIVPESHCHLIDRSGEPTRLTLLGVNSAAEYGIPVGRVGELIPHDALRASRRDLARVRQLFTDAIWTAARGDAGQIETLLREAVRHDAECLSSDRIWMRRRVSLMRELKQPVRDLEGRPGIATINGQDPRLGGFYRQGVQLLEEHDALVQNVILMYKFISQDLTNRVSVSYNGATAPGQSRNQPPPPTHSKPPATPPTVVHREPKAAPATAVAARPVTVDTTPLQKEREETMAALAKLKTVCLDKAAIDCT